MMGYSNSTPNYKYPQWTDDDKPTFLGDMNRFFLKLDADITAMQSQINNLQSQILTLQNKSN